MPNPHEPILQSATATARSGPARRVCRPAVIMTHRYVKVFVISFFLPLFLCVPLLLLLAGNVSFADYLMAQMIALSFGILWSCPYALFNMVIVRALERRHYRFSLRQNLIVLPVLFTLAWGLALTFAWLCTGSSWFSPRLVFWWIVYMIPSVLTALVCAFSLAESSNRLASDNDPGDNGHGQ